MWDERAPPILRQRGQKLLRAGVKQVFIMSRQGVSGYGGQLTEELESESESDWAVRGQRRVTIKSSRRIFVDVAQEVVWQVLSFGFWLVDGRTERP